MTDFSKVLFYCSELSSIMTEVKGRTPLELWQYNCDCLEEEREKYAGMAKKDSKSAIKKKDKLDKLQAEISRLELIKDTETLTEGCKAYLTQVYAWQVYKKWVIPTGEGNRMATKGTTQEAEGIMMVSDLDGRPYTKNESRLSDNYLIGIPDILYDGYIIDVKSSWDMESFLSNLGAELDKKYWWQLQGYMSLANIRKAEVSYCLLSTPQDQIESYIETCRVAGRKYTAEEIKANLTFDEIPEKHRRIKFVVERDDEAIGKIHKRIDKCREYLSVIENLHLNPEGNV